MPAFGLVRLTVGNALGGSTDTLTGAANDGPSDAAVVRPVLSHYKGIAIGNGMNPRYSDYSAYDMAANAWEWTKDWYDSRFYHLFGDREVLDPPGPSKPPRSLQLTVRGCSKRWIPRR